MHDLEIMVSSELMVAHVEGITPGGERFVDGWLAGDLVVIDRDRIIVSSDSIETLIAVAKSRNLTVKESKVL